ncbi:hypothetical protein ACFOLJ_13085 [Rugamonas sp. CCM 8940]
MNPAVATILAISMLALAPGCAPQPHRVHVRPEVIGTLSKGGVPVAHADVLIGSSAEYQAPCKDQRKVATTGERGEFRIAPVEEEELFGSPLNPPATVQRLNNVCFQLPGEAVWFGAQLVTRQSQASSIKLACDPLLPKKESVISMPQICH